MVETITKESDIADPVKEKEKEETPEDIKKRSRKPPKDGPCKGCGKDRPLNRLMLCYKCWIDKQNSDKGWKEGQPHPAGCGCALECTVDKKGGDN